MKPYDGAHSPVPVPLNRVAIMVPIIGVLSALLISGCGGAASGSTPATSATANTATTTTTSPLPGVGKPAVIIGDKNFTEQFLLGELYAEALTAQGYTVQLNQDIGPVEVTMAALTSGRLAMYPEYLGVWDYVVAHHHGGFRSAAQALLAGRRYATTRGLALLDPTPFSDTSGIAVTLAYAQQHRLRTIADLRKVATSLVMGGPPQFKDGRNYLPLAERVYAFAPASYQSLDIGSQYPSLAAGAIQAAAVNTTDGELASGDYVLLGDPRDVFGWGQAVPVVPTKVLAAEGPAFAATINDVSALLTTNVMRWLNGQVDTAHRDPAGVAREFLETHGVIPPGSS
jgi:osmoprotectant transport system substrate-binding protein